MSVQDRLVNVPTPEPFEAASSWLARLAVSQGASLWELLQFLQLPRRADLDRFLCGGQIARLRTVCGLPEAALALHDRIMTSLNSMSPVGDRYLALAGLNGSRFRYCPLCMGEMRTTHFQIHWRFIAWRWCPIHDCLLEDSCPECEAIIVLPADLAESNAGRLGYASLNRCQSCGYRLNDARPCYLQNGSFRRVSEMEELCLKNGRALLAALYHGWFAIKNRHGRLALPRFIEIEQAGVLPLRLNWLEPVKVSLRLPQNDHKGLLRWPGSTARRTFKQPVDDDRTTLPEKSARTD